MGIHELFANAEKQIPDSFSYKNPEGDEIEISNNIKKCPRTGDTVAVPVSMTSHETGKKYATAVYMGHFIPIMKRSEIPQKRVVFLNPTTGAEEVRNFPENEV